MRKKEMNRKDNADLPVNDLPILPLKRNLLNP